MTKERLCRTIKQEPWKIRIHFSASRNTAGFNAAHRGVIDAALLNSWLAAVKYITPGKGGLWQHHWMPLPDAPSFPTATCWGFCQHIVLYIISSNGKEWSSYTMAKGYREWADNFLAGPVSVHLNSAWTRSIYRDCKIYCLYTVVRRSMSGEQVLCSLYKAHIRLEFLVHFSWSHYMLTAFVPHIYYRTQQTHIGHELSSWAIPKICNTTHCTEHPDTLEENLVNGSITWSSV